MPRYDDDLSAYISGLFADEDDALATTGDRAAAAGLPAISIAAEEGAFLKLLTRMSGGGRVIEIGTLGGYSGTWIAGGLADNGRLWTLELEDAHAAVAQNTFERTGVAGRIEIIVGNAIESLARLIEFGPFDMVFIDADKQSYRIYYEWAVANLRPGGIVAAHNAFRAKGVLDPDNPDQDTQAIRRLTEAVAEDDRVDASIFPAGDGMLIAVKK
jgi:predicted O-methyltransferase YrrM